MTCPGLSMFSSPYSPWRFGLFYVETLWFTSVISRTLRGLVVLLPGRPPALELRKRLALAVMPQPPFGDW